jgi:SNF2 family DNA or RNA helicase
VTTAVATVPAYTNPRGLYEFQMDHIAQAMVGQLSGLPGLMATWDTGLGKSHFTMALAAMTLEDHRADTVVLACEKVKLEEWMEDFAEFTNLTTLLYHGPSRKKRLAREGWPQVLISTYETLKADWTVFETPTGRRTKVPRESLLLAELDLRQPVMFFDEVDKLSNRSSGIYKSFEFVLKQLRKRHPRMSAYGLTATPVRKDIEDSFNQLRLIDPSRMPLVGEFEKYFVAFRDAYDRPRYHDWRLPEFMELARPLLLVKSKEDPDVRAQFPQMTEESLWVTLEGEQKKLYDLVARLDEPGTLGTLRQICAHPAALVHSGKYGDSKVARKVLDIVGEDLLAAIPSAKTERLVEYLRPVVLKQEAKAVVFSFFGPSVLPLLRRALEGAGMAVHAHDDPQGLQAFREAPGGAVLLCSDAASRGINLPEASYLVEYDVATTYGTRTQRLNRISRIGQGGPTATVRSMLARETVEVGLMFAMLKGNQMSDDLLGVGVDGGQYMTMAMRRQILGEGQNEE